MSEDNDDKQHEASQRKLDEARKRGEVPKSAELTTAAAYGGLLLTSLVAGPWIIDRLAGAASHLLAFPDRLQAGRLVQAAGLATAPLLAVPGLAALASLLAQRALVFAPGKLAPKLSRLSPLVAARNRFGLEGLVEFAKNAARMLAIAALLAWQIARHAGDLFLALQVAPVQAAGLMGRLATDFLLTVALFTAAVGGLDFFWQRQRHLHRNRMSRQEMTDEMKDAEGDPHVRGQRRRRGQEIALNRMLQDVAKADVVIVNPTHYAVALRWKRGDRHAPICLAKGTDELAARIRERAALAGVPLHRDPPTARALHATVAVGKPIRPEHYGAVAAAIRFAEAMRRKRRGLR